jgi:hypothetical protein
MLECTLKVHREGTTYTYDNTRILSTRSSASAKTSNYSVEVADVVLEIGDGDFVGLSGPLDVDPSDRYRAQVILDGTVVIDGAVPVREVIYRANTKTWEVLVTEEATAEFWALLDQYYYDEIFWRTGLDPLAVSGPPANVWQSVVNVISDPPDNSQIKQYKRETRTVARPEKAIETALAFLAIPYTIPDTLFPYRDDSASIHILIGRWKLSTLVREVAKLAGWRVRPSYQSFPSTDLEVEIETTRWPDSGVDLGGALQDDLRFEHQDPNNWALSYANDIAEASPDPREVREKVIPEPLRAPWAYAVIAAEDWRAQPPYADSEFSFDEGSQTRALQDPRSIDSTGPDVKFTLPKILHEGVAESTIHYGRPLVPHREERDFGGKTRAFNPEGTEDDTAYIFEVYEDDNGDKWAVHHREVGFFSGPGSRDSAAWASSAWQAHEQDRGGQQIVTGTWPDAPLRAGASVTVFDKSWSIREVRQELASAATEVTAARRAGPTQQGAATPGFTEGFEIQWTVIKLGIEVKVIEKPVDSGGGGGLDYQPTDFLVAHWEPSATQFARETRYDVFLEDTDASETLADETVVPTAFVFQLSEDGGGGQNYNLRFEVAPENRDRTGTTIEAVIDTTETFSLGYDPPPNDFLT